MGVNNSTCTFFASKSSHHSVRLQKITKISRQESVMGEHKCEFFLGHSIVVTTTCLQTKDDLTSTV